MCKSTSSKQMQTNQVGKNAGAARKHAWTGWSCMPDAPGDMAWDSTSSTVNFCAASNDRSLAMASQEHDLAAVDRDAADDRSTAMVKQEHDLAAVEPRRSVPLGTPAEDVVMICKSTAGQAKTQEQASEQAKQQLSAPWQQDPMEELEKQWAQSLFVNMDHDHQQQLRVVIGLPRMLRPSHDKP
eukprot:TRINITY_DN12430_c0_g1_i1.p1 TRINITY_DN12430_c0_g1~~TRINITY_DN12430_c0_g1_i1.p1  ORF type:complete len:184 (+),score=46.53 TRINITY_DN12430_c0_g1_i1:272-823(+)